MKEVVCFCLVIVCMFVPFGAGAMVHHVPGEYSTIQEAIWAAASSGDTVLVADGTYSGPNNRDIQFNGKSLTVRSENGPENCVIDCEGTAVSLHRGFYFSMEGPASVLDGFTIRNGYVDNDRPGTMDNGGGILCLYASPTIRNCIVTACTVTGATSCGGGICYHHAEYPVLESCRITDNQADFGGGVAFCSANRATDTGS
ncbi:right-handed parallel beta-helix repeat-containing protein [bacterium]|nr:right-handed parallel beta-helix repeat-containing protein [candidate division CSSED10-310 bacterium]